MDVWYELMLACDLKEDLPSQVVDVLNHIISPPFDRTTLRPDPFPYPVPEHSFFTEHMSELSYEWHTLLLLDCRYFPGDTFGSLNADENVKDYRLTLRAKHRSKELIASFLHWIAPYSSTEGFVGYTRCDEDPDSIQLIYFDNNTVFYTSVYFDETPPRITRITISEDGRRDPNL